MDAKDEERPLLKHLNEHIVCSICTGYLIDATTLVECLHSFCRGCIVRRLSRGVRACPVCNTVALSPILPDNKLQRLVYLTVPGLFRSEVEKRRQFRLINPQCPNLIPLAGAPDLTFDDLVSLSLTEMDSSCQIDECNNGVSKKRNDIFVDLSNNKTFDKNTETSVTKKTIRYLKCPAGVTVRHILRLLMLKRGWDDSNDTPLFNKIEIFGESNNSKRTLQLLNLSWTLLDLACILNWKRDAPMKLMYRIIGKEDESAKKSHLIYDILDNDSTTQVIEDSQRPPTPPPSPKPNPCIKMPCSIKSSQPQSLNNSDYNKDSEAKKPRCEVTPLMRAPDKEKSKQELVKDTKAPKVEHHKRKKHRNKRVIAEITTTPREDMLKLKVRLTPCPSRITQTVNQSKDKIGTRRVEKQDSLKSNQAQEKITTTKWQDNLQFDGESDDETIEQILDSIPDEIVQMAQDMNNTFDDEERNSKELNSKAESDIEDKPKDAEVLRQLGLVNTHEVDREKLEKKLQESKANRVRSLLAEKQMRDTLESIKIMTGSKTKDLPVGVNSTKKKGPPPLTPLKTVKLNQADGTNNVFGTTREIPLDLSNGGLKDALDLSSNPSLTKQSSYAKGSATVNKTSSTAKNSIKIVEDRKSQDLNLRTLSDAAVSLLSNSQADKQTEGTSHDTNKVALKIPQPHQRLLGFGMKMKPNLGIRHIPNPQAIVASQFRNQRSGYFGTSHRQS